MATVPEIVMTEKPRPGPVKLRADVIKLARVASAFRGEAMSDMLSDILRPILTRIVDEEMEKQRKLPRGKGGPKA